MQSSRLPCAVPGLHQCCSKVSRIFAVSPSNCCAQYHVANYCPSVSQTFSAFIYFVQACTICIVLSAVCTCGRHFASCQQTFCGVSAGIAVALTSLAPNYPVLVAGRLTYGLGIGFAMHAAPAYLAETAPESVRGLLIRCAASFLLTLQQAAHAHVYLPARARTIHPLQDIPTSCPGAAEYCSLFCDDMHHIACAVRCHMLPSACRCC